MALCNLSGMAVAEEAGMIWERGVPVRPGECVFHGVSPHTCGFASSVTLIRVSQWGPGQYMVSIEDFQRCSSSFWNLHGNKRAVHWFPFFSLGSCSNMFKVIKFSTRNIPRTKSLKTRVFHTFLWKLTNMVALQIGLHNTEASIHLYYPGWVTAESSTKPMLTVILLEKKKRNFITKHGRWEQHFVKKKTVGVTCSVC